MSVCVFPQLFIGLRPFGAQRGFSLTATEAQTHGLRPQDALCPSGETRLSPRRAGLGACIFFLGVGGQALVRPAALSSSVDLGPNFESDWADGRLPTTAGWCAETSAI